MTQTCVGDAGRSGHQCLQGDQPERHQLRQCSSNGRQLRTCRDRVHPP
ncbi:hypothetical protein J2R89_007489 [Bradyrhizobium elkanii]|nr:hypothetical protein [Bradyrhizobium elkanii]